MIKKFLLNNFDHGVTDSNSKAILLSIEFVLKEKLLKEQSGFVVLSKLKQSISRFFSHFNIESNTSNADTLIMSSLSINQMYLPDASFHPELRAIPGPAFF